MLFVVPKAGGRTIADLGPEHFGVTMEDDDYDDDDDDDEVNNNMFTNKNKHAAEEHTQTKDGIGINLTKRPSRIAWVKDMIRNRVKRRGSLRTRSVILQMFCISYTNISNIVRKCSEEKNLIDSKSVTQRLHCEHTEGPIGEYRVLCPRLKSTYQPNYLSYTIYLTAAFRMKKNMSGNQKIRQSTQQMPLR